MENGEPRFVMLETIREYALERLAASGEEATVRAQHAAYYLALAERAESELHSHQQRAWLERLRQEHDNLQAVLAWSQTEGSAELGLRLMGALWPFWLMWGQYSDVRMWLDRALEQSVDRAGSVRAKALYVAGAIAHDLGDSERARALFEQSIVLYRDLEDKAGSAWALLHAGRAARERGDYAGAGMLEEESLALFRGQGTISGSIWALLSLGDVVLDQGDTALALVRFQEVLALCRSVGDTEGSAHALYNLGRIAHIQGDEVRAIALLEESRVLFQELDAGSIIWAQLALGQVAHAQGNDTRAAAFYRESLTLVREQEWKVPMIYCLEGLAGAMGAQGQTEWAARLFGAAEALRATYRISLRPIDRADYDRAVATVRAQLDEATFAAAWAAGRALPLEQAIADALGEQGSREKCQASNQT
jgi:tetratricopeptide (TPR) repeat protein